MSNGYKEILRQARSSRIKYVFNALIEIRKTYIKSDKGVEALVGGGLVERLIELLKTWETVDEQFRLKVTDICASILGNMCMLEMTRKQVIKLDGINVVAELFLSSDSESIQNRCCRCLANILLTPGSWKLVHDASIVERIVKLLGDSDNDECKQTYIRAIRLLGQTVKNVQVLLEENSVSCVAKQLDENKEGVCQAALRCLNSLSIHCCNVEFATQIVMAGKLDFLLTASKEQNPEAFQLILRLCNLPNFRPEFGNANGIGIFVELFNSDEDFYKLLRRDIVDVLSLCCKEAVNRVKLRDSGCLQILMSSLSDDEYALLNARVVSALVCFMYDQSSFDVLLDNGLVDALIKQLNNYMMGSSDTNLEDGDGIKEIRNESEDANVSKDSFILSSDKTSSTKKRLNKAHNKVEDIKPETVVFEDSSAISEIQIDFQLQIKQDVTPDTSAANAPLEKNLAEESVIVAEMDETVTGVHVGVTGGKIDLNESDDKIELNSLSAQSRRPVYSIDSPTYKPVSDWDASAYTTGAKCIETFSPSYDGGQDMPIDPYSPLSHCSYYSPSEGSPEYFFSGTSPEKNYNNDHSPRSRSTHLIDKNVKRNIYSGISSCRSPISSPEQFSLDEYSPLSPFSGSDSTFDPEKDDASKLSPQVSPISDSSLSASNTTGTTSDLKAEEESSENLNDTGSDKTKGRDEQFKPMSEHYCSTIGTSDTYSKFDLDYGNNKSYTSLCDKTSALPRKRKKVPSKSVVFENNILILLSRISQMTNPSKHLVTMEIINTLIGYIQVMEAPLSRAARLLSRIFRNPLCFESLLRLNIPRVIFKQMLREENVMLLMTSIMKNKNDASQWRRLSTKLDTSSDDGNDSDRFSVSNDSPTDDDIHPAKRQRMNSSGNRPVQSYKGAFHKQEESVCDEGRCGVAFLEDLSGVAGSSYGRGIVEKLLCEDVGSPKLDLCVTVMFSIWSSHSRYFYFKQLIVLDQVMSVILDPQPRHATLIHEALIGLSVVAQAMDCRSKYQTKTRTANTKNQNANYLPTEVANKQSTTSISKGSSPVPNTISSSISMGSPVGYSHMSTDMSFSISNCDEKDCYLIDDSNHDLDFLIEGEKISTNRQALTGLSDVFTAMLEGNYSEAKLSEISVANTSIHAFRYIIHYLYGCKRDICPEISNIYKGHISRDSAMKCIEIITEADKYLLHSLKEELLDLLHSRYVIPESTLPVLKFSILHDFKLLQKRVVYTVMVDNECVSTLIHLVGEILDSSYKNVFLQLLEDILTE